MPLNLLYNFSKKHYFIMTCVFLFCTMLFFLFLNRRHFSLRVHLKTISLKGHLMIIFICTIDFILFSLSTAQMSFNMKESGKYILAFCSAFIVLMSTLLLFMFFRLQYYYGVLKQANDMNLEMISMEERYYKNLQKKTYDLRAFRHDYQHHILAMKSLADAAEWEKLEFYIQNLSDFKESVSYISTNHPVSDAVINDFYERFSKEMDFHIDGKFAPSFFVNDADLCIILSNLIKNAVEAAQKCDASMKPFVSVSLFSDKNTVSIRIKNSSLEIPHSDLDRLNSDKPDSFYHGFGLKNVKNAVANYRGKFSLQYENNVVTTGVILLP